MRSLFVTKVIFSGKLYLQEFQGQVLNSITYFGILFIALSLVPSITPLNSFLFSLLVIPLFPLVRLYSLSEIQKITLLNPVFVSDPSDTILYLLAHVTEITKTSRHLMSAVDKLNTGTSRKRKHNRDRATQLWLHRKSKLSLKIQYIKLLFNQTYGLLSFPSEDALCQFMRFTPDRFQTDLRALFEPVISSLIEDIDIDVTVRESLERQIRYIESVVDLNLILDGHEVITQPGTSKAVLLLRKKVNRLDETKAKWLIDLVDDARGIAISEIAGLRNLDKSLNIKISPERVKNKIKVAQQFGEFLKTIEKKNLVVATPGYSDVVFECLSQSSDRIKKIYVIESEVRSKGESQMMRAKLDQNAVNVSLPLMDDVFFREGLDLFVFGFEIMDIIGDVYHPRGFSERFQFLVDRTFDFPLVAVGESWKILDLKSKVEPALWYKFPAKNVNYVITDTGILRPQIEEEESHGLI